ncbi:MAG: ATP-binding cassette domain-containing protein [Thalassobaculaceae bacterium]|nr:ATP-binding cassette domain-containing protein [Thalassobaculaceae bacterium]
MRLAVHRRGLAYVMLFLTAGAVLLGAGDAYAMRVATLVGTYAIAAIGFQLVFGRLGLLALSQGALFAIGAYALALSSVHWGWPPVLGLVLSVVVPALAGALVAVPIARLESHYVALATLGLAQLVLLAVTNLEVTGGANGLYGIPPLTVFGFDLSDSWRMLAVVWVAVAMALCVFAWATGAGRAGRLATLRDAPHAALALGLDPISNRLLAFTVAGALAGLAGGFQALGLGVVSPAVARFDVMITLLAIAVVGGRGSVWGAVTAAAILVPLPEVFRGLEQAYLLAYGVMLLAAVVALPTGIDGLVRRVLPDAPAPTPTPAAPKSRKISVLRVERVAKRFGGVQALDGAGFDARAGEVTGIIGANGSGKTTLLNIVTGLETADAGVVRLDAIPLLNHSPRARAGLGLARGFQHPEIPGGIDVLATVSVAATLGAGMAALERVGLAGRARVPATSLGPAERRRLDIARALAAGPTILLLDEPASGLGAGERADLAVLLCALAKSGMAVVVVEHGMDFLLPIADRLVCLDAGRVLAAGPTDAVCRDPAVIAAYLGTESAS